MSNKIRLLPEVVANQIAAGEVVNRPSCVVKEMMENSIDAGATCVVVNSRDGGRDLIQIVDNGCGMSPVDARMAFDRHATSKISNVDDIYKLRTFGFRGEALASIAAVAQVELRTRREEDELGTITEISGGEFLSQRPVAAPVGSQFMVRNLFYNVPARRKFMEKPTSSVKHIKEEFQRVALCNPQVRFELYCNDAPIYHLPQTTLANRIVDVVGGSIKNNLLEVSADTSIVKIRGFVGRPAAAKKTKPDQFLFVNGRYFRSAYLLKALMRAYEKLIPEGTFPACFLYFDIAPDKIDVNVHPQKTEVKFSDEEAVWQILNAAVRETLGKTGAVPMMDFSDEGKVDIPVVDKGAYYAEPPTRSNLNYNPFLEDDDEQESSTVKGGGSRAADVAPSLYTSVGGGFMGGSFDIHGSIEQEYEDFPSESEEFEFIESNAEQQQLYDAPKATFSSVMPISNRYAAAIYGGKFVVVDTLRAKESLLYERYLSMLKSGSSVSQQLLFPEMLTLSEGEFSILVENLDEFVALGFDLELCDGFGVQLNGVPSDCLSSEADTLLYDLIKVFETPTSAIELRRERVAKLMSQHLLRPFSETPSQEVLRELLSELEDSSQRSYTPSGKAVMVEIPMDELKSKFL